ncbi:transposable element Tcb2 transposase [Trichonephila clavipes]|nr:transposable element Tcb2 transposase [Trichonephila clavipes]
MRRCWDQWIREMSFTRRPGPGSPRQTSRRVDHHIVRNARGQLTASSATIQAQVTPSLGAPDFSRSIRRRLAETEAEWNQIVFSDEFRFNLSREDNRVRVLRPSAERLNPAFALQRHTAPTAGVMVWGVVAYNTRSPVVLIRCTMTAQWYVNDVLQPHALPLMQWLP